MDVRVSVLRPVAVLMLSAIPGLAVTARSDIGTGEYPATHGAVAHDTPAAGIEAGATGAAERADAPAAAGLSAFDAAGWERVELGDIDRELFTLALDAAAGAVARGDAIDPATLSVIDFSRPSTATRMWVYDLRSRTLLFDEIVSHGRGSGLAMARTFSNLPGSHASSLGLFRTAEAYVGSNGYSLRLDGLEPGINDRARERAIVIHGAPYVSAVMARAHGYLGRSHGCPALRPEVTRDLIDAIKGGGLLFAYYPDPAWLQTSPFLN